MFKGRKKTPPPTPQQIKAATAKLRAAHLRGAEEAQETASVAAFRGLEHIVADPDVEAVVFTGVRFDFDPSDPHNPTPFLTWVSHADNLSPGMIDSVIRGGLMVWLAGLDLTIDQRMEYAAMIVTQQHGLLEGDDALLAAAKDRLKKAILD